MHRQPDESVSGSFFSTVLTPPYRKIVAKRIALRQKCKKEKQKTSKPPLLMLENMSFCLVVTKI